jgi:ribosomal-protein-serine acetyltransferase
MLQHNGWHDLFRGHSRSMLGIHSTHDSRGLPLLQLDIDEETTLLVLSEDDAPELFRLTNRNRTYLREWLPWLDSTRTIEDTLAFIRSEIARYTGNRGFSCGIWYQDRLVGTISFHDIDWNNRKVEIGYWLDAGSQGKGLVTKACIAVITYAFERLHLTKVEIRCATGNQRSRAIPLRLGFTEEGIIRQGEWLYDHFVDLVVYSMLVSQWNNTKYARGRGDGEV